MGSGKIRLLIFMHDLAPFGAQRVALNTVKYLNKGRFEVSVCSFWGDETLAPEFSDCGAEVIFLRARRFLDPAAWGRLFKLLLRLRPHIVQTNMPELSLPVRLLGPFLSRLKVLHAVENPISSEPWYWRLLNRATFFLCSRVVFCSESIAVAAGFRLGGPGDRLRAVPNGIDLHGAASKGRGKARVEFGIAEGEKVVCCLARLARQKGQDVLIKAAALLVKRGLRICVLLAGDGEDLPALRSLTAGLGVEKEIRFLGRRGDAQDVLAASDVYAAPSRWEGLGLSLGEAMLAGLPCVGTAIPGHADILKDGVTGLTVPAEDSGALADGISRLIDDVPLAAGLSKKAGELIRADFTVESMAGKYEKIYLEIAGGI
ncbi:MAG: glycosyltransferase family 4 protein [Elusimicrobiales bacterium]|nr:glycosyltransferase family 4 protein [Elusimicrobiales bacterium]